jgi:uroporphyrinogen III methyltransferase/synthase
MPRVKTVLITRPESRSHELMKKLENASNMRVIFIPLIQITPASDGYHALDKSICNLSSYDGLIFSSTNGVDHFYDRLELAGLDLNSLPRMIAAVGPMTKAALIERGVEEVIEAEEPGSSGLIKALKKIGLKEKKFLFPRARDGRDDVVEWLRKRGCAVEVVEAYHTILSKDLDYKRLIDLIDQDEIDQAVFASQSAVKNFIKVIGKDRAVKFSQEKESLFWNGSFFHFFSLF